MRSMDVSRGARIDHAFRAVSEYKRDGYRPPGTGLLPREEVFGANMRGLNTQDVGAIRRGMVTPYNVKQEMNPIEPSSYSAAVAAEHHPHHNSQIDAGQLKVKRGSIDSKYLGPGRGNNPWAGPTRPPNAESRQQRVVGTRKPASRASHPSLAPRCTAVGMPSSTAATRRCSARAAKPFVGRRSRRWPPTVDYESLRWPPSCNRTHGRERPRGPRPWTISPTPRDRPAQC